MKNLAFSSLLIIMILLQSQASFGQKNLPPGTIKLDEKTFIDRRPITNLDMREFVFFMLNWNNDLECLEDFYSTLPKFGNTADTLQSPEKCATQSDIDSNYFLPEFSESNMVQLPDTSISLHDYYFSPRGASLPSVYVSHEVAQAYCRWRALAVLMQWSTSKNEKARKKLPSRIQYRLPTDEEYQKAIISLKNNDDFIFPVLQADRSKTLMEMTDKEGTAISQAEGSADLAPFQYDHPSSMLGFRCVCEILDDEEL